MLRYYEKKDKRHLAEARYYAGRVYRDLGDAPQALDYFGKALEALPAEGTHDMEAYIYSQMGTLFFYQNMRQEALQMYRNALRCDSLRKDSVGLVYDYRDIADCYHYQSEQADSALFYYRKALEVAKAMRDKDLSDMINNQIAAFYTYTGEYEKARDMLVLSRKVTNSLGKSALYSIASKLYHKIGKTDSALYFYRGMLDFGTVYAKRAAHQGMAQIALMNHDPETAMCHLLQERAYADSILKLTDTETIRKMHSLYNYQLREKENLRLEAESQKRLTMIYVMLLAGAFVLAAFFGYLQYSRRKSLQTRSKLREMNRLLEEQHRQSVAFIEENNRNIALLEQQQATILQENTELKAHLEEQKEQLACFNKQAEWAIRKRETTHRELMDTEIFRHIHSLLRTENNSTKQRFALNWLELEKAVNGVYPDLTARLYDFHKMSGHEYHVCLLLKAQIPLTDIARLLSRSPEAIISTCRRLHKKMFGEEKSPKHLEEFIRSL